MCEHPDCITFTPDPNDPQYTQMLLVQCTTAALQALRLLRNGWTQATQGITNDVADRYGFAGITRMVWVYANAIALLPAPQNPPRMSLALQKMAEEMADKMEEVPLGFVSRVINLEDQLDAARTELLGLAKAGSYDRFADRLDEITDADMITTPLVTTLTLSATAHLANTAEDTPTACMDQFLTACQNGLSQQPADEDEKAMRAAINSIFGTK
ncbi:MAG TPA: hypothetical protein VIM84_03605 [Gemmatimonadales bacterium]